MKVKNIYILIFLFIIIINIVYYKMKINKIPTFNQVIEINNFINSQDCQNIINKSIPKLKKSTVFSLDNDNEKKIKTDKQRKSKSAFIHDEEYVEKIKNKICKLVKCSPKQIDIQFLAYEPNGFYNYHNDDYDESENKRVFTLIIYLNNVDSGGETHFRELNKKFKPVRGKALFWKNVMDDNPNKVNQNMIHSGLKLESGKKYALNIWIHEKDRF